MGCFCAVPEEFYCEVLLLDESKLTLTTQQQGIKVGMVGGAFRGSTAGRAQGSAALSGGCHGSRLAAASLRCGKERQMPPALRHRVDVLRWVNFLFLHQVSSTSPRLLHAPIQPLPTVLQWRPKVCPPPISSQSF